MVGPNRWNYVPKLSVQISWWVFREIIESPACLGQPEHGYFIYAIMEGDEDSLASPLLWFPNYDPEALHWVLKKLLEMARYCKVWESQDLDREKAQTTWGGNEFGAPMLQGKCRRCPVTTGL